MGIKGPVKDHKEDQEAGKEGVFAAEDVVQDVAHKGQLDNGPDNANEDVFFEFEFLPIGEKEGNED